MRGAHHVGQAGTDAHGGVVVTGFERLAEVTVDFGTTTLLIGSNNAGKSSVLQALQFAVSLAQSAKLVGGVQWAGDKFELSFSQNQLLYCPVSDGNRSRPGE